MNNEKRVSKRRVLVRYIALAACILVIAAVTVIAIAAANNWFRTDISADNGNNAGTNVGDNNTDVGDNNTDVGDNNTDVGDNSGVGDNNTDVGDNPGSVQDNPASSSTTFLMPVSSANVTCDYDFICNPSMCGVWYFHEAIDMSADAGSEVVSCLDGTVESVVRDDYLDGTSITISHADGVSTVYSFIDVSENLKAGDKVTRGQVIGTVAQPAGKEYMQGAHLHFAVKKNGSFCDPSDYLDADVK